MKNVLRLRIWGTSTEDNRTLNYDKYFSEGDENRVTLTEFNSENTKRLNLEETKAKIASLEYIQNELKGLDNIAK